jgi:hypothetical protein
MQAEDNKLNNSLSDIDEDILSIIDVDDENTGFVLDNISKKEIVDITDAKDDVVEYNPVDDMAFDVDFEYIRNNIKDVIKHGSVALERMILVAEQSEHPRAYEVVATLMKALVDANKDLISTHKQRDERSISSGGNVTNVQNNTVFVGSTKELSKIMRNKSIEED